MEINPKLNLDAFEASFHAIDTHTVGEFTRIITSGFPKLEGDTMIERKNFLAKHYDKYRQALMFEPRGHHDMFGALLTDPIHPEADFGVIFMDTGEYLNMCGHGTIGSVTAIIETGLVPAVEPYTEVVLDAPAGIIRTKAEVKNGKVLKVHLLMYRLSFTKKTSPQKLMAEKFTMIFLSAEASSHLLISNSSDGT